MFLLLNLLQYLQLVEFGQCLYIVRVRRDLESHLGQSWHTFDRYVSVSMTDIHNQLQYFCLKSWEVTILVNTEFQAALLMHQSSLQDETCLFSLPLAEFHPWSFVLCVLSPEVAPYRDTSPLDWPRMICNANYWMPSTVNSDR